METYILDTRIKNEDLIDVLKSGCFNERRN